MSQTWGGGIFWPKIYREALINMGSSMDDFGAFVDFFAYICVQMSCQTYSL